MNTVIIGLGSNIDPEKNIEKAKHIINDLFTLQAESKFIRTKPVGYLEQDDFINGAVLIKTDLNADQLKLNLKQVEETLGRQAPSIKFGPRTIDLDIVIFNNEVTDKDFYERDFLKNSVLELLPNLKY